jgi:hypothetical protein
MLEKCTASNSDKHVCNPCAYTLAYLFAKYERHVEMAIE